MSGLTSADAGTAHKAAATARLNANNIGAAQLASPAYISTEMTTYARAAVRRESPERVAAGQVPGAGHYPTTGSWYAEGGQVFDNRYMLTTKRTALGGEHFCRHHSHRYAVRLSHRTKSWTA